MDDEAQSAMWREIARLKGETAALAGACGYIAAEVASMHAAPSDKLSDMLARIQGRLEGIAAAIGPNGPGSLEGGLAINELIDHLSRVANESLGDLSGPDALRQGDGTPPDRV